jgi:predicted RND superfamily exporter protein
MAVTVAAWAHWLVLGTAVILFALVATSVDLSPRVDANFFFSSTDAKFQESKQIEQRFPAGDHLIVSVSSPQISSLAYLDRLDELTQKIKSIDTVSGVRSVAVTFTSQPRYCL